MPRMPEEKQHDAGIQRNQRCDERQGDEFAENQQALWVAAQYQPAIKWNAFVNRRKEHKANDQGNGVESGGKIGKVLPVDVQQTARNPELEVERGAGNQQANDIEPERDKEEQQAQSKTVAALLKERVACRGEQTPGKQSCHCELLSTQAAAGASCVTRPWRN